MEVKRWLFRWYGKDQFEGEIDVLPDVTKSEMNAETIEHLVINPPKTKISGQSGTQDWCTAKCRVKVEGSTVELDYGAFKNYNQGGIQLGVLRLHFDSTRTVFERAEWCDVGGQFERAELAVLPEPH